MKERLSPPPREISDFMFEQRIFDFANKNLDPFSYRDMRKHMDASIEAREKVGAVLLAFEYFSAISEIKMEYDETSFLKQKTSKWRSFRSKLKPLMAFLLFVALFAVLWFCADDLQTYFGPKINELKQWIQTIIN